MIFLKGVFSQAVAALTFVLISSVFFGSVYASESGLESRDPSYLYELIEGVFEGNDEQRAAGLSKLSEYMRSGGSPNDVIHVPYMSFSNITLYQRVLWWGDYDMIKLMLDFNADPNQGFYNLNDGESPLSMLIFSPDGSGYRPGSAAKAARLLLAKGADVDRDYIKDNWLTCDSAMRSLIRFTGSLETRKRNGDRVNADIDEMYELLGIYMRATKNIERVFCEDNRGIKFTATKAAKKYGLSRYCSIKKEIFGNQSKCFNQNTSSALKVNNQELARLMDDNKSVIGYDVLMEE